MFIGLLLIFCLLIVLGLGFSFKLASDSRSMDVSVGINDSRLTPCPSSPNCVSSDETSEDSHYIAAIADQDGSSWMSLVEKVSALEGASLVVSNDEYAHFTFTTKLMRYMDDVEFHHRPLQGEIAVRSASRVGQGDMNANRDRIEIIRSIL